MGMTKRVISPVIDHDPSDGWNHNSTWPIGIVVSYWTSHRGSPCTHGHAWVKATLGHIELSLNICSAAVIGR